MMMLDERCEMIEARVRLTSAEHRLNYLNRVIAARAVKRGQLPDAAMRRRHREASAELETARHLYAQSEARS